MATDDDKRHWAGKSTHPAQRARLGARAREMRTHQTVAEEKLSWALGGF